MPQPLERIGRPASPGIAVGPLAPFSSVVRPIAATTTDAAAARARLTQALAAAAQELARLLAAAEPDRRNKSGITCSLTMSCISYGTPGTA